MSKQGDTCSADWFKELPSKSTFALLADLRDTERSLLIHYARRAVVSLFTRLRVSTGINTVSFHLRSAIAS